MRLSTGLARGACLAIVCAAIACASPPNKEIDQAQGAIDAARAAGAERYAPAEYSAATQALEQAHDAVTARDYRLALNHALESREQAQNAARAAADTRATLRGDTERAIAEVKALFEQTRTRVDEAPATQLSRAARRSAQQRLTQLEADLQKADAALQVEEYTDAEGLLTGVRAGIEGVLAAISKPPMSQSPRRRN